MLQARKRYLQSIHRDSKKQAQLAEPSINRVARKDVSVQVGRPNPSDSTDCPTAEKDDLLPVVGVREAYEKTLEPKAEIFAFKLVFSRILL